MDETAGPQRLSVFRSQGDFVVAKASGPAYQLAVVVDDAAMEITHVIRGDDLLPSTPRQLLLYEALERSPPSFRHLPLVVGTDGKRLAKRHGDTRVATYRVAGVAPERLIGLLASWSGLTPRRPASARELLATFTFDAFPRERVVFGEADDAWLRGS